MGTRGATRPRRRDGSALLSFRAESPDAGAGARRDSGKTGDKKKETERRAGRTAAAELRTDPAVRLGTRHCESAGPPPARRSALHGFERPLGAPRRTHRGKWLSSWLPTRARPGSTVMILPQVHLRKPCYDFYFL